MTKIEKASPHTHTYVYKMSKGPQRVDLFFLFHNNSPQEKNHQPIIIDNLP